MKYRMLLSALVVCCTLPLTACDSKDKAASDTANRTQIADGKASIVLPEGYIKMSDELLAQKYPAANRPKGAWYAVKDKGKVILAVKMTQNYHKEAQLGVCRSHEE